MPLHRRRALQALAALPLIAATRGANAATTDLVLNCDTALAPVLAAAADRFARASGVRVRIFPTGPGLLLPQVERRIQNDLIVTRTATMAAAAAAGLLAGPAQGAWRNPLVIAARRGAGADALTGRLAVSDPTPASDMDGPAIAAALDLGPSAVLGVIDTDAVADLLAGGAAEAGLLHATDVRTRPGLEVVRRVPDAVAPAFVYAVATTTLARRPNPGAFAAFLVAPEGGAVLRAQGLEIDA